MNAPPVIKAESLSRLFNGTVAVDQLTLQIDPGEVFGLLGHNGAGKTTTIRMLNGVLAPTSGRASVLGLDPLRDGPRLRRHTGILTETPSLDERLTGRENLRTYAELYGVSRAEIPNRLEDLLQVFELAERADDKVGTYSKGMKQRLALARALLHEPEILYLDEPTAGLDPVTSRRVHQLVSHLSMEEGRTVLLCTHNLAEAQQLCSRVAVLEHGQLVALGTPVELAHQVVRSLSLDLEVTPDGVQKALHVVEAIGGVIGTTQEDGTLTITGVDRKRVPELIASLVAAGIGIYRVAPQEPSLEDVYFALHDAQEDMS